MIRVLLLGAGGAAGHNFVDALRQREGEYYVVGTDVRPYHLGLSGCDQTYVIPPVYDHDAHLEAVRTICAREAIDFVHAQPDPEVLWLVRNRHLLVPCRTMLPQSGVVAISQDKVACYHLWRASSVPVPPTVSGHDVDQLREELASLLRTHRRVWVRARRGAGSRASLPVSTVTQAVNWIEYWTQEKGLVVEEFMASAFLPGKEYAWMSLWREGRLVTSATRERVEYVFGNLTPSGQSSSPSVARTVWDDGVNQVAYAAVKAMGDGYQGIACVDLKASADGHVYVTEINAGRFFTTSNFFAHAPRPVNFPDLYVRLGMGLVGEDHLMPAFNAVEADLYWVRQMDMGYQCIREGEWPCQRL